MKPRTWHLDGVEYEATPAGLGIMPEELERIRATSFGTDAIMWSMWVQGIHLGTLPHPDSSWAARNRLRLALRELGGALLETLFGWLR